VGQVAALAGAIDPRYRALVLMAAYDGLRWGELVGLHVKRVDLLHGRVTVAEQVAEVKGDPSLVGKRWGRHGSSSGSPARAQERTQSVRYPLASAIGRGSPPTASTV
jgi:integrase